MKTTYVIAILVSLLLIGCKPAAEEVPTTTAPEPVIEPVEEVPEVVTDIAEQKEELSYETADATAQRLLKACKAGNKGVCVTLKNKYGIDVDAEAEPMAEPAVE